MTRHLVRYPDEPTLAGAIAARLTARLGVELGQSESVHVGLTGGGIGTAALAALAQAQGVSALDWGRVHLWWGDERFLPAGDPERNETAARDALIDSLAIPPRNVHPMPAADQVVGLDAAAAAYAEELAAFAEPGQTHPAFTVMLLGIGPDGHVASLFPGLPGVTVNNRPTVAVSDSPKPPPQRISLTMPVIQSASEVWILASGPSKQAALHQAWVAEPDANRCPASVARGRAVTLLWADEAAAAELPQ